MATELNQNECEFPNDCEFPVCGGWCEGPNRCMKIGGSKHLNAGCYSYNAAEGGQVPKHPCVWHKNCGNSLHSPMCSAIELEGEMFEDKEKWLCITCHDSTRSKNNNKKKKNKQQQQGNENIKLVRLPSNMTKTLLLHLVTFVRVMVPIVLLLLLLLMMTVIIRRMQDETIVLLQLKQSRLLPLLLTRRQKRKNNSRKIDITRI